MTLPPMNEGYGGGSFPPPDRYPPPDRMPDPRMQGGYSPSPTNGNGYPQPPMPPNVGNGYPQQAPTSNGYGPPPGPPSAGPRPPSFGGGDPRNYAQEQRPPYGQEQRPPYPPDNRQYYPPPPQGAPRPPSYGPGPSSAPPPPGYGPGNGQEQAGPSYYPQPPNPAGYPGGAMYPGLTSAQSPQHSAQAAAPRQRTSIACRYCRKRKIRCSGYQNTADGKCTNCKKTGNECVFQPVSNNASTAFVPVSAVPGGVPPGTPLYGAFGQPLAPQQPGAPPPPPGYPPQQPQQQQQQQPQGYSQGPPPQDYPMQSPTTGSYYPSPEDRAPQGVRRPRAPDDEGMRLPPPRPFTGDDRDSREPRDPRRLSPASTQSNNTPPGYNNYYGNRNGEYEGEPSSAQRGESSPGGYSPGGQSATNGANPMSLGSLMDAYPPPPGQRDSGSKGDIDSNMLGRLNRKT